MKIYINKTGEYEVHEDGSVYSLPKPLTGILTGKGFTKRKLLKASMRTNGYLHVNLGSMERNVSIHTLVAKTYIKNEYKKKCVNHINGVKTDNRVENLEWCTMQENVEHAYKTGLVVRGSKLSEWDMEDIRIKHSVGQSMIYLSKYYSVGYNTIRRVINGADYKTKFIDSVYNAKHMENG